MYVLFKTDDHHSKASEELLGVASTKENLIRLAKQVAEQEEAELTEEDKRNLTEIMQTQGYEVGEFLVYSVTVNELIE